MTLDLVTTILGLIYIWLEYRVSIWLWLVGVVMPALDTVLYWQHGLYGDAGMAVYYVLAAVYGFGVWKWGRKEGEAGRPVCHTPRKLFPPMAIGGLAVWGATYWVLTRYTGSTVPTLDSFTNALSIVALWALSRKYVEQWALWIVVDVISCYLYAAKGIPFKAALYGLYTLIAIAGYRKWNHLATSKQ